MTPLELSAGLFTTVVVSAVTDNTDPSTSLLNYGALGALALILIAFAFRAYKRESDRSDALQAKNDELNNKLQEQEGRYQKSLADTIDAVKENTRLMTEIRADQTWRAQPPPRSRRSP